MAMHLVHEFKDGDYNVKLEQSDKTGLFKVTYGLQKTRDLTQRDAAHHFGECVFHSLACAGKLDNE